MSAGVMVAVRHLSDNLDGRRIPLNATERAERPGVIPYWGANAVVDWVDEPLVNEPVVLVGEDGAPFLDPLRSVAFAVDEPIWPNNHIHVLRPKTGVDYRYLAYALNAVDYAQYIEGSTRDKLTQSALSAIKIPGWDLATQLKIADYLDHETAEIDAFIADQMRFVALLEERKEAVLSRQFAGRSESVTTARIGRYLKKLERPAPSGAGVVTAFRDGEVAGRWNRRVDGFTEAMSHGTYQGVAAGDLVFHGLDGFAGAVGIARDAGMCSPVYHVCAANVSLDLEYVALLLRSLGRSGFLEAYAWSVRQRAVDYRNWQTFSQLPLSLPTLTAQSAAVHDFRSLESSIALASSDALAAVALAKERRAALITAAVTRQIDVTAPHRPVVDSIQSALTEAR